MTVNATQLQQPVGRLPADWYTLTDLQEWIDEGVTQAADVTDSAQNDAAVRAWAYYRAYERRAIEKADQPQAKSIPDASVTYGSDRASYWQAQAALWLAEFGRIVAMATVTGVPAHLFARVPGGRGR